MRAQRLHRWLARHPRAVLALLLAFAVELVPSASGIVRHRHVGGGVAHTHAGRVLPASAAAARPTVPADGALAVGAASAADVHEHAQPPLVSVRSPLGPNAEPRILIASAPPMATALASSPARRIAQARAPPPSPA